MLRHLLICGLLTLLTTAPANALTDKTSDGRPTIRIGVDNWPPFRQINNHQVAGIDDDLWQILAKQLNFAIRYVQCPWKRCLSLMKTGDIDAMSGLAWRPERAKYIRYVKPAYYSCSTRFYVRSGEEARLTKAEDLEKLSIGMVRGSAYYPAFDSNDQLTKVALPQENRLLPLLASGRVDSYIGTDCQADFELSNSQWSNRLIKAPFNPEQHTALYIGLSRQSPWSEQTDQLSTLISELLDRGFNRKIHQRYYSKEISPQPTLPVLKPGS